jgi:hypothetical protein
MLRLEKTVKVAMMRPRACWGWERDSDHILHTIPQCLTSHRRFIAFLVHMTGGEVRAGREGADSRVWWMTEVLTAVVRLGTRWHLGSCIGGGQTARTLISATVPAAGAATGGAMRQQEIVISWLPEDRMVPADLLARSSTPVGRRRGGGEGVPHLTGTARH